MSEPTKEEMEERKQKAREAVVHACEHMFPQERIRFICDIITDVANRVWLKT